MLLVWFVICCYVACVWEVLFVLWFSAGVVCVFDCCFWVVVCLVCLSVAPVVLGVYVVVCGAVL